MFISSRNECRFYCLSYGVLKTKEAFFNAVKASSSYDEAKNKRDKELEDDI